MYQKKSNNWLKHYDFILWDLLCLQAALVLAYAFRHGNITLYAQELYRNMAMFLLLGNCVVIFLNNTFKNVLKRGYYKEFLITARHVFFIVMLSVLYMFSTQTGEEYSRITMYLTWIVYMVLSYAVRIAWKKFLSNRMESVEKRAILLVTSSDLVEEVLENFQKNTLGRYSIRGLCITDKDLTGEMICGISVVATYETAAKYVCREWIDEVFINLPLETEGLNHFVETLGSTGLTIHLKLLKLSSEAGKRQLVEKLGNYTVLTTSINYMTQGEAMMKRALDILGGLVGCVLTGLIALVVGPMIYFASPGPIIFAQTRVGQNGKTFKLYKFRSMYLDAEERKKALMEQNRVKDGMMFKLDFDTRIIGNEILPSGEKKTGIGEFIRKTSLDEFPQFFNVLKGDMSLVGTRPPTMDEWEKYELHHRARMATKPGITGMWQISGRSNITDFEEVVKLDTKYINEWDLGLDIKILLKTVTQVLKQDGSM